MDKQTLQTPYGEIDYRIEKKHRNKHTYLRIKEGFVDIKTTRFASERFVKTLLLKNAKTIFDRLQIQKHYFLFGEKIDKPADIDNFYKHRAVSYLPPKALRLIKKIDLHPTSVKVTRAKTRWGSCSHKNSINLSCYLVKLPHEVIEYVIIHELCHIKHKNHGRGFWQEVAKHCAEYKKHIALLREYEQKAY